MPKHKHPFARLQQLNEIFQSRTSARAVVKAEALADELGISLRQLRTDMDVLKDRGAPLEYDAVLKGWRYRPGNFFTIIDNIPLTGEDLAALRIAVETLAKVNHLKGYEQLPAVFAKIHRAAKKWMGNAPAVGKAVYFDPLPCYDGSKHLPFFLEAIEASRRTTFQYRAYHAQSAKTVTFDPWFLRHYDRRWYVGGFSHDPDEQFVRVFPLERIEENPHAVGYFHDKPPDFDAASYWQHIYGITVPPGGQVESIVLEFSTIQGKYFQSSPFFEPFKVISSSEQTLTIGMDLIVNIDLIRKLASFGADVRVLQPTSLAERMRCFFHEALARQT